MRILSLAIATLFSYSYIKLYTILVGGFVIYHYPYWPPVLAGTYVVVGILIQAYFCFGRWGPSGMARLLAQIAAGLLYVAAILLFPGSIYQS
jgi:hypothetical protein